MSKAKNFALKIAGNRVLAIILGILLILVAAVFAPIWGFWDNCPWKDWGMNIINILILILIVLYLALYLVKKVKSATSRPIKVLTIIEFSLMVVIAIGCILKQFKVINVGSACQIFALALWARGSVEVFRGYYFKSTNAEKYPVWQVAIAIFFVTFGALVFANPFIPDIALLWAFVIVLLATGIVLLALGITNKKLK